MVRTSRTSKRCAATRFFEPAALRVGSSTRSSVGRDAGARSDGVAAREQISMPAQHRFRVYRLTGTDECPVCAGIPLRRNDFTPIRRVDRGLGTWSGQAYCEGQA